MVNLTKLVRMYKLCFVCNKFCIVLKNKLIKKLINLIFSCNVNLQFQSQTKSRIFSYMNLQSQSQTPWLKC